jgi:hypothetical protein
MQATKDDSLVCKNKNIYKKRNQIISNNLFKISDNFKHYSQKECYVRQPLNYWLYVHLQHLAGKVHIPSVIA